MKLYADISKIEPQDDGTLKVWGYASSGAVDADGETITPDAMKAAIPDYMKFGAVREMHGSNAAGTAIEIGVDDTGKTTFGAHVVDPVAVKKVTTQTYKGFSIGGKVLTRDPTNKAQITGLKLVEVSLVDRPANPEAVFTMFKAEAGEEKPVEVDPEKIAINAIAEMLNKKEILPSQILKAAQDSLKPAPEKVEAEKPEPVAKAGATFSKQSKEKLADVHATAKTVCDKMDALGYKDDADGDEPAKVDVGIDLAKLHPVPGPDPAFAKLAVAEDVKTELAKRDEIITKLTARLEKLEAQPMPGKALLKAITKGDDVGGDPRIAEVEIPPNATPEQLALAGIKKAFRTGGRLVG